MQIQELIPMPPDDFKAVMDERGWTYLMLSKRWAMTERRVRQIVKDADRPRYYDDAVRALPFVLATAAR